MTLSFDDALKAAEALAAEAGCVFSDARGSAGRRADVHVGAGGAAISVRQEKQAPDAVWIEHRLSGKRNAPPQTWLGLRDGGAARMTQVDVETAVKLVAGITGLTGPALAIWPYAASLKTKLVAFRKVDIYGRVAPEDGETLKDGARLNLPDGTDPIDALLFQAARRAADQMGRQIKRGHVVLSHPDLRIDDAKALDATVVFEAKLKEETTPTRLILSSATPQEELDALAGRVEAIADEGDAGATDPIKPWLAMGGFALPPDTALAEAGFSFLAEAPLKTMRLAAPPRPRIFSVATIHIVAREDAPAT